MIIIKTIIIMNMIIIIIMKKKKRGVITWLARPSPSSCSHQLDLLSHDFDFRPIYLDLDHDDHDEVYDDTDGDATSWTCSNIS